MALKFNKAGRALIIRLDGELDAESAGKIKEKIDIEFDEVGARDMIFDLNSVTFMDSSGIGMMIGRCKKVKPFGGRVKVFGAGKTVGRIIELSGLGQLIRVYKTEKAAMEG